MDEKVDVGFLLDGIDQGAQAALDLSEVFLDIGELVTGRRDAVSDDTIRKFRLVADIVDPPPGKEKSDERRRVIADIRRAREVLDAFEKARRPHPGEGEHPRRSDDQAEAESRRSW